MVCLLSMRTGAVGLTLTTADHCFILDTPFNSAVEEQAIDRIHRIGQTRPVTIKRFVMQGTIEERIIATRRQLGVDRLTGGGAAVADESLMTVDGPEQLKQQQKKKKKKKRRQTEEEVEAARAAAEAEAAERAWYSNVRQEQRIRELAAHFGCSMAMGAAATGAS